MSNVYIGEDISENQIVVITVEVGGAVYETPPNLRNAIFLDSIKKEKLWTKMEHLMEYRV